MKIAYMFGQIILPQSLHLFHLLQMNKRVSMILVQKTLGNFLGITSGSAILMEQTTGTILYEYNSHEQLRPASVTKVMTILLIMEALDNGIISLEDQVPCSEKASSMGGSQIWLDTTETLTVHEMLKAICVVSANDCCVATVSYTHLRAHET